MRFFSLIIFIFLSSFFFTVNSASSSPLSVDKITITGQVTDSITGEGIFGAAVIWLKNGRLATGASTDSTGKFKLDIDTGKQVLLVTALGFTSKQITYIAGQKNASVQWVLSPSSINLLPVEIIGNNDRFARNIPGTASRIDERTLRLINPIGTQEVLLMVPGVQVATDDGMGNSRISVGIRGLNPRRSSRVLILEDGIPIAPGLYVYPNMYYNPPVERIDKIEVIKGSSAIKHGPQTMGGVINYITHVPTNRFGGRVDVMGGTNGLFSTFVQVGGFGSAKIAPQVQLLYKTADGYRENNHFEQFNGTVKLHILPSEKQRLYIKLNFDHEVNQATYTGLTEYSFKANPNFNPKKHDVFYVDRFSIDAILHDNINANLTANTLVYGNYFERSWWRENDIYVEAEKYLETGKADPVPYYFNSYNVDLMRVGNGKDNFGNLRSFYVGGVERNYAYKHSFFGLPAQLDAGGRVHWERFIDRKVVGNAPNARTGIYYYVNDSGETIVVGTNQSYETIAFSFFGSQKIHFTEKLEATFGLRTEAFEQENIDRLSGNIYKDKVSYVLLPGLGLNYSMGKYNLFGGIHRGYTPPSSSTLIILDYGNSSRGIDLRSETSWNSEIGLRRNSRDISFEAAFFYMHIYDMVAPAKGVIMKNLGQARSAGFELSALVSPENFKSKINWLPDLNIAYTFMNTEVLSGEISASQTAGTVDISGNEFPYVPDHTLIIGLSKNIGRFTGRIDYQYVSRVYTDYENLNFVLNGGYAGPIPSYYLLNASFKYDIGKHFTITATGKNLLDRIYIGSRLHSAPNQPEANISSGIIPGPRRQLNLGVRYNF